MKKLLTATAATALLAGSAYAGGHGSEVKIGVFLGFTGPIESLVAEMGPAAEFAIEEVNASGLLLGGAKVTSVRGDTTCVDAGAATAAIERLITADGVSGVVGGDCSGVTGAALNNVAMPNGMVMISPSATSPGLSHMNNEDNGLFFRTAPSDARQGVVMTEALMDQGIKEVAVTYTNNDYGKGLADSFQAAYEAAGGTVTISAPHEDGKADYSAEVGALAAAGGERLVVAGYVDQGGSGIIQAALDTGAFDSFHFPDGMIGQMPPADKDAAMARFVAGETKVLVATTVIEVGVNVPNASIMVIERAEIFGLAQLHQLRGRVGRGSAASTCLLLYRPPLSEGGQKRLTTLRETEDGFRISEVDLEMRGAGDLIGTAQSGLPRFRIADLESQAGLMKTAQTDARALLETDANLTSERGQAARTLLWLMEQDRAIRLISVG